MKDCLECSYPRAQFQCLVCREYVCTDETLGCLATHIRECPQRMAERIEAVQAKLKRPDPLLHDYEECSTGRCAVCDYDYQSHAAWREYAEWCREARL